jgi:hypothetical protein
MSNYQAFRKIDRARAARLTDLEAELGCRILAVADDLQLAQLSPEQQSRLRTFERELGASLVAFETASQLRLAKVGKDKLKRLHDVERELGFVLVAYELAGKDLVARRVTRPQGERLAKLTPAQGTRLRQVEEEVGLQLMAFAR